MGEFFDQYIVLVQKKIKLYETINPDRNSLDMYLQGLRDELWEVEVEIKDNNLVYLEDELWDILRDYMNLLYILENEGKIRSRKNVFQRSFEKYWERVSDKEKWILRKETKDRQKRKLKKEYDNLYIDKNFI